MQHAILKAKVLSQMQQCFSLSYSSKEFFAIGWIQRPEFYSLTDFVAA
jgi:hypothetical protein